MWHLSLHWLFLRLSWNGLHTCTDPCLLSWQLFTRTYVVFTTTSEINIWHRCYFQTLPASRQWFENKNHPDLKDAKCLSSSEIFFCCLSFVIILNSKLQRSMWCRVWQRIHVPVWLQLPDLRRVLQRLWISVHHKWDVSPLIPTPQPRQPLYVRLNSTMQSCYTLKPCCLCVCATENSCRGRCGENFKRGRLCTCDADCVKYNQCCSDFKAECDAPGES